MSLKNIDLGAALRRLADKRIEEAMSEGKFSNLAGAGKPLDLEPMPAEENARLTWWAVRILKQNDVIPDEIRWRKLIDTLTTHLRQSTDEARLPGLVAEINALVHKVNTLGTNALRAGMVPLSEEAERAKLRERVKKD